MKIQKYKIISAIVLTPLLFGVGFAADTVQSTVKTVTINKVGYTIDTCNTASIVGLKTKVLVSIKTVPLSTKRRILTQVKLLEVSRKKACTPTGSTGDDYITIVNPTFLDSVSVAKKTKGTERTISYKNTVANIIDKMIKDQILTITDKETLKGKVTITYVDDCKKIDGITSVKQRYDSTKKWVKNDFVSINLNVSTCDEANFGALFATSYRHVVIHELGHYIYYFKDPDIAEFENICRQGEKKKSACLSFETFYSKYAMGASEEDYAETFAYRYQGKEPEFDIAGPNINLTTINIKAQHFSDLFKR